MTVDAITTYIISQGSH